MALASRPYTFWIAAVLLAACAGSEEGSSLSAAGEPCEQDAQCQDGLCDYFNGDTSERECAQACTSHDDCPGELRCGLSLRMGGERFCLAPCARDSSAFDATFACVDGALVACEEVDADTHCSSCGCSEGNYCPDDNTYEASPRDGLCKPKVDLDEPCTGNINCLTGNCDAARFDLTSDYPVGRCVEAPGTACDAMSSCKCEPEDDAMVCGRHCGRDTECGVDQARYCLGNPTTGIGTCHIDCRPPITCPGGQSCEQFEDNFGLSFSACVPQ